VSEKSLLHGCIVSGEVMKQYNSLTIDVSDLAKSALLQ